MYQFHNNKHPELFSFIFITNNQIHTHFIRTYSNQHTPIVQLIMVNNPKCIFHVIWFIVHSNNFAAGDTRYNITLQYKHINLAFSDT